ncbi:MAG: arginine--tRNA ligase, partial [Candidatus Saccharimonadales bacterium]
MNTFSTYIQKTILELFGVDQSVQLTRPDPQFGDYATNAAMQLAKPLGQNPRVVAEQLADRLRADDMFSEVSIAGPGFINLRVSASTLERELRHSWSSTYGETNDGAGKTVIVEYPSPNMAKPYSIGHLRPGNQGWAVKRLMEVTGWTVITDNHLGDYGAPFGTWVVGFLKFSSDQQLADGGVYELGRVYIETKQALKDEKERGESELADQVQDWLLKLERGDEQAM